MKKAHIYAFLIFAAGAVAMVAYQTYKEKKATKA